MALLDGDLANSIYQGFKDKLLVGEVRRKAAATSGGQDAHGDPIDLDDEVWDVQGFIDTFSRFTRAQAGIPSSIVKVCVFAQSAPDWAPRKDDLVRLGARWTRLAGGPLDIDPAGALWTLDAEEVGAPQ
jgi:hypothetical protein